MKKNKILNKYIEVHNQMIENNGFTEKSLWGSKESQVVRFKILSDLFLTKNNFSLLDVGSGLCDFYQYLKQNEYKNFKYTGLEINASFVNESKLKYPEIEVIEGAFDEFSNVKKWDYAVASGIFNLGDSVEDTQDFFINQFENIFKQINIGVAVNFLSFYSDKKDEISVYHNPVQIIDLCLKKFSKYIKFYQHYLPHDFTIIIYKEQIKKI